MKKLSLLLAAMVLMATLISTGCPRKVPVERFSAQAVSE